MEISRYQSMLHVLSRFQEEKTTNPKLRLGFTSDLAAKDPFYVFQPSKGAMKFDSLLTSMKLRKESRYDSLRSKNVTKIVSILDNEMTLNRIVPTKSEIDIIQNVISILKANLIRKKLSLRDFEIQEHKINTHLQAAAHVAATLTTNTSTDLSNFSVSDKSETASILTESTNREKHVRSLAYRDQAAKKVSFNITRSEEASKTNPMIPDSPRRFSKNSVAGIMIQKKDAAHRTKLLHAEQLKKLIEKDERIIDCDEILANIESQSVSTKSESTSSETITSTVFSSLLKKK
jgi:hypothetical protein